MFYGPTPWSGDTPYNRISQLRETPLFSEESGVSSAPTPEGKGKPSLRDVAGIKVLHIITRLDRGGSSENTLLTAVGLRERGYEVVVVAGPGTGHRAPTERKAHSCGVEIKGLAELVREISPLKDIFAFIKLFFLIRRGRYQIVHTHSSKGGILGRWAAWLAGAPIIIHTPHGHVFYGYFGPLLSRVFLWLEWASARMTRKIISLTDLERDEHVRFGVGRREQFVTIASGVELGRFTSVGQEEALRAKEELALPSHAPLIGSVGRLEPIKGYRYFLEAAALVLRSYPEAYFLLAGDGRERSELSDRAQALGIGERFCLLGWRDDVPSLLKAMDLFVIPSLNEGMGRSAVEAMAAGLPVVASRVGSLPEVVAHGDTGLLVPPADPEALASAILSLLKDPRGRRAMGERARAAVDPYSVEIMVERIEALYRELLREKGYLKQPA